MNTTDCIFCKIISGEIPSTKVYEDDQTLGFLDITPVNPGHTLIIPKEHHVNALDVPEDILCGMMAGARTIARSFEKALDTTDVNIYMNNGSHSGQMVFHAHIHIIPRYESDGHKVWHGRKNYSEGEAQTIADKIKKAL